jgi:hypothetical protein
LLLPVSWQYDILKLQAFCAMEYGGMGVVSGGGGT